MSCDGGGARATVEVLLHFHGFKNLDLRSRGLFCVEAVVFPVSSPSSPGVPLRTFHDASAKRSAARGVLVHPVEGDADQRGASGISAAGLPSYTSSLLTIRFTNEQVQLNEGCLFRVHIDADWLETDIIAIEFRLLTAPLPENEPAPTEETSPRAATPPEPTSAKLKEVGKVILHTKCASSKGGLHRYHPLVFRQPHLCVLDVTLHMALTSINHPGGPAGLAAAIAAHAFPSEEGGAPAPRGAQSPARRASSGGIATPPRSEGRRRSSSGGKGMFEASGAAGASPMRPRFITPGRMRKSAFVAKGRSSSFGGGSTLGFTASPGRSRTKSIVTRPHRLPLSAAALEAASHAIGLSTALGYAPPALDPHRGVTVRAVYRAAELLYSRHALGLRWSKGALTVAQAAAAANAAEMATASAAAAAAVAAKRKSRGKGKKGHGRSGSGGGGGGGGKSGGGRAAKGAHHVWQWGADLEGRGSGEAGGKVPAGRDTGGGDVSGRVSPRRISQNGELEDMLPIRGFADSTKSTAEEPALAGEEGTGPKTPTASGKSRIEVRTVVSPRNSSSMFSAAPKAPGTRKVPPSPGPAPMGQGRSKKKAQENGGAAGGVREGRGHGTREGTEAAGDGGKGADGDGDVAGNDGTATWTWGGGGKGASNGKDTSKTPLPSDLRQLSRVIHARLNEESTKCSKAWSAFAKSTFECGRRDLIALREEWVRDTTRAWSGQCLEIMSQDRSDLVRLNQALLDPDGFLPLRARAGIRLKRRASPTGGGGGAGGGGSNFRRRRNGDDYPGGGGAGAGSNARISSGMARLKAMSSGGGSGTWSDAKVFGRSNSMASASGGGGAAAGGEQNGDGDDDDDDDDDEDGPPLLDALVPKRQNGEASSATTPRVASLLTAVTPKDQSTASAWGGMSPWMNGSTPQRSEHGWLSRIASGGGGSVSSPTGSTSSFSFSGASTTEPSIAGEGTVVHFPPPPQSLLPVFDRDLHGFDSSAREDEQWGELPFLVVESWGGLGEDAPPEPAPLSPMLGGDEYRLFQEIASNSLHHKKPPLMPNGKTGGGTGAISRATTNGTASTNSGNKKAPRPKPHASAAAAAAAAGAAAAAATRAAVVKSIPPIVPPYDPPAAGDDDPDADTPPPPCYVPSTPRHDGNSAPPRGKITNDGGDGPKRRPVLAHSSSVPFPEARESGLGPSSSAMWGSNDKQEELSATGAGAGAGGGENKSIWDQPEQPARQQRGPKYYTARRPRPTRTPSLPSRGSDAGSSYDSDRGGASAKGLRRGSSTGSGFASDSAGDLSTGYSSSDDMWSAADSGRESGEVRPRGGRSGAGAGGKGGGGKGDGPKDGTKGESDAKKKRTRRDEIQKRMWGKRPSWTGALIEPAASAATAAAAAASVPGATAREAAGAASAPRTESGLNHLIVLVHGLGGRPADMALMRSYLQTLMPGAELMVATSLQDVRKDNLGVEAMGKKLAEEVHNHVTRFCPYLGSAFVPVPTAAVPTANAASLPLSPVTPMRPPRRGSHALSPVVSRPAPGSSAAARAVSEELGAGAGGGGGVGTPSRPPRRSSSTVGGGSAGSAGGVPQSKGMLSFVCFSLGGLVARAALLEPAMVPYLTSMQCFVTLACPHLGQTSTPLSFFKTGAWAVRKLTGLQVLHELDLDDAEDPRETVLYRLCLSPGLERFRTIVFAANPRDGFVPLHSASVRTPPDVCSGGSGSSRSRTAAASAEMAEMLMSKVDERTNRVVRMTLDAPRSRQSQGAIDTVIGRAGHMCFIDSAPVAWLLALALLPFLEENVDRSSSSK
eukprot:g7586.t1